MRNGVPKRSFREGAPMEGAIFMSNTKTREQCFQHSIFGLPLEYESFVNNIKKGMPLFLFDHGERKLYGVFEAASDGGMHIDSSTFQSIWFSYPAQVRFKIVWKCRPLRENEFSDAIEDNYYKPLKFYFDLSHQQVVQLYRLFNKKRVDRPPFNYSKSANLGREHSSECEWTPERTLIPNVSPFPAEQPGILMPSTILNVSTARTNYSAPTGMHPIVAMPSRAEPFGVPISHIHSSHHDQLGLPHHNIGPFLGASTVDCIPTEVPTSCPQAVRHEGPVIENQRYPLPHGPFEETVHRNCPQSSLSYGCMNPTDGVMWPANRSYSPSLGCVGNNLVPPPYVNQDPNRDIDYGSSTHAQFAPLSPHFSLANPQSDANRKDHCNNRCSQCPSDEHIHAPKHQCLRRSGEVLTPPRITRQGIPTHPEVPEVSAIGQQKESFIGDSMIPRHGEYSESDNRKHGFNCKASGSSGLGNDFRAHKPDQLHRNHCIGAENNTLVSDQPPKSSVFSRLSQNRQSPSIQTTGPSLNQMLDSLPYGTHQSSVEDIPLAVDVGKQWVSEQVMDIPCPLAELDLPSLPEEGSAEAPFLNFKRRSEAGKLDANLGKEIRGEVKRRKLVRPSFGEDNNNAASSVKYIRGNGMEDDKVEDSRIMLTIDLNKPATENSDVEHEDGIVSFPSDIKVQIDEGSEIYTNNPNCSETIAVISKQDPSLDNSTTAVISKQDPPLDNNTIAVISKQDPPLDNSTTAEKIPLDLNVADFIKMDESKLQAIFESLQALGKLKTVTPNICEDGAKLSTCGEDSKVNTIMKSD